MSGQIQIVLRKKRKKKKRKEYVGSKQLRSPEKAALHCCEIL